MLCAHRSSTSKRATGLRHGDQRDRSPTRYATSVHRAPRLPSSSLPFRWDAPITQIAVAERSARRAPHRKHSSVTAGHPRDSPDSRREGFHPKWLRVGAGRRNVGRTSFRHLACGRDREIGVFRRFSRCPTVLRNPLRQRIARKGRPAKAAPMSSFSRGSAEYRGSAEIEGRDTLTQFPSILRTGSVTECARLSGDTNVR